MLDDDVAAVLSLHRGVLCLPALVSLTATAAEALSIHQGTLVLSGLTMLEPGAAAALLRHAGDIDLYQLTQTSRLDSAEIAALLAGKTPLLTLPNVQRLDTLASAAVAGALVDAGGAVSIPNLRAATAETMAVLLSRGNVSIPALDTVDLLPEPLLDR
jgi:hypothetical protein